MLVGPLMIVIARLAVEHRGMRTAQDSETLLAETPQSLGNDVAGLLVLIGGIVKHTCLRVNLGADQLRLLGCNDLHHRHSREDERDRDPKVAPIRLGLACRCRRQVSMRP
jgi:hypothetical protein